MKRSDTRDSFELKAALHAVGKDVAAILASRMLNSYRELVTVGELKVALENLCTNLDDLNLSPPEETMASIRDLADRLGVASSYWEPLQRRQ